MKNEEKVFTKSFYFLNFFYLFLFGCLFGTYFEEILFFIQHKEWTSRAGVLYGPFSPLYGCGVLLFVLLLGKKDKERNIFKTFFMCTFIGGVAEYFASLLFETFFQIRFWDYSTDFLNIHGRTTIPFMLVWGLFGTFLMKVIVPLISKGVKKIPIRVGVLLSFVLAILLSIDILLSFTAFIRMRERQKNHEALTFIGEFCDQMYSDDFMKEKFPILKGK